LVAAVVVLYDRVERRISALPEPIAEIVRLTQPIDVERFKPSQPLRSRPRVAMTLGNYVHGQRLAMLRPACDRTGIELRHVGMHGEGERPAALVLNDADIVLGKARVILEAELAAARATAAAQATAAADEAARLARLHREVTATRRWRALQTLLMHADRLRSAARLARQRPPAGPRTADAPVRSPPGPEPSADPASGRPRSEPPAPFVVGVPRSGTTLLRLQLDAHPRLAIGPETGFGLVAGRFGAAGVSPDELLAALTELDTWPDLALDQDAARRALELAQRPWSFGNGLRAIYAALAARDGKPRWGDKTPVHSTCMPAIAAALPEARFIHIIRDGRDVAASVRELTFAPGDGSIEAIAGDWRERITTARTDAAGLAHYREVRYERLVTEPEAVLRELCDFVELDFDAAMLRAHERAADMLARLPEHRPEGATVATRAERSARHVHLLHPPDPTRAGRWRETLTADEVARFELTAGTMLRELGYELAAAPTPQPTV
jgi:hypothetical protein